MANDNQDALTTGALILGGGAAGYAAGRWIVARWITHDNQGAQPTTTPTAVPPSALPPATPSHASAPSAPVPPPRQEHPMTTTDRPVSSPDQVDHLQVTERAPDAPVSSPDQIDAVRAPSGPVAPPSQVDGPPADAELIDPYPDAAPSSSLPRRFDDVLDRYRGAIPIEYLRALIARESDSNPKARTGHAIGLLQIIPFVLDDYNTRHGTHYQSAHLVEPAINVAIGCELLRIIIRGYARNHPRIPNLQADWTNPRFVELLTFGWNAGFSEAGGVGRVARYLEQHGITDLTIDLVTRTARAAGASRYLSNPAKVRWCKSVAALYARERAGTRNGVRNARRSARYTREGRTIRRDDVPISRIERVDLGDQRYAISPRDADVLSERVVRLLNRGR